MFFTLESKATAVSSWPLTFILHLDKQHILCHLPSNSYSRDVGLWRNNKFNFIFRKRGSWRQNGFELHLSGYNVWLEQWKVIQQLIGNKQVSPLLLSVSGVMFRLIAHWRTWVWQLASFRDGYPTVHGNTACSHRPASGWL